MPTIKDRLYFTFNGVSSKTFGLIHVNTDSGMYDEALGADRSINETGVKGSRKPLHNGIDESPLSFDMTIAFEGKFTDAKVDSVIRWLFVDYYKPLYFEGKESKVFYCMPVGDPRIIHNGLMQGYITIQMRCDSSQIYSPLVTSTLETITGSRTITINSDSHYPVLPEISIKKSGAGTVSIQSIDDGNAIFEIKDLTNAEDIYLNCERETIQTDIVGVYRFDKITGEFPRLLYGANRFKITGDCTIQFRYKNLYRF